MGKKIKKVKVNKTTSNASPDNKMRIIVDTQNETGMKNVGKVMARVIEVDKVFNDKTGESKSIPENEWQDFVNQGKLIGHPFPPLALAETVEYNTELFPSIEAMEINISGFGHTFKPRVPIHLLSKNAQDKAMKELDDLEFWFEWVHPKHSFTALKRRGRRDMELTGSNYMEVIENWITKEPSGLNHIPAHTMAMGKTNSDAVEITLKRYQFDRNKKDIVEKPFKMEARFRQFAQRRDDKFVWFRELGDPRFIDCTTGEVMEGKNPPVDKRANSILHNDIYSPRTPYGIPRWIGAHLAISGSRLAQEINFATLESNNIPSMVVSVSGGVLTEGSIDRITDFVKKIGDKRNWTRFLLLEAEPVTEGFSDAGQMKIDVKPLTKEQIQDALYQDYEENTGQTVRRQWRLPPIFVGRSEDYTRATAESSRRLADEQVFDPERREEDELYNKQILPRLGAKYYKLQSKTPNVTDDSQLVKLLTAAEKSGGMTPDLAREIVGDIMGRDLGKVTEIPGDVPFTIQVAEAAKNTGPVNQGTIAAMKGDGAAYAIAEMLMSIRHALQVEAADKALDGLEEEEPEDDQEV
jgi:PBSX family phage portal protein